MSSGYLHLFVFESRKKQENHYFILKSLNLPKFKFQKYMEMLLIRYTLFFFMLIKTKYEEPFIAFSRF